MKNSKTLSNISISEPMQLPLPGFRVEVESKNPNFKRYVEMTLSGRVRIHSVKKR